MISFSTVLSSTVVNNSTDSITLWDRFLPPEDISVNGHLIDFLFKYTTAMNIVFFGLVCIGLFGFSFLYHKKRHPIPFYTYGNKKSHIIIATVIGALVFFCVDMSITAMSNEHYTKTFINWPKADEDVVKVEVMGQQWAWNFRYAGADGVFNTEDDVLTLNDLRVPYGKKIVFQLISKDVIHSLYFPNTRRKVDAIPGRLTRMWFELTKAGDFDIACAEMCGTYHYRMQAKLKVYSQDDFDKWLEEAQSKALEVNDSENPELFWGWKWES